MKTTYKDDKHIMNRAIDSTHAIALISFVASVYFDWQFWKQAPMPLQTFLLYGIIFSFMFVRFLDELNFKRVKQDLTYPPRIVIASLSSMNTVLVVIASVSCIHEHPASMKPIYFMISALVVLSGVVQFAYLLVAIVKEIILRDLSLDHQEMKEEVEEIEFEDLGKNRLADDWKAAGKGEMKKNVQ